MAAASTHRLRSTLVPLLLFVVCLVGSYDAGDGLSIEHFPNALASSSSGVLPEVGRCVGRRSSVLGGLQAGARYASAARVVEPAPCVLRRHLTDGVARGESITSDAERGSAARTRALTLGPLYKQQRKASLDTAWVTPRVPQAPFPRR